MLYNALGWSVFAGLLIMIISIPVDTYLSRLATAKVMLLLEYRDKRAKALEETLSGMRIIKLYAWESSFMDKINKIRVQLELKALRGYGNIGTISSFISNVVPFIITFVTFGLYSVADNMSHGQLNAQLVFVSLSLFNKLKDPLMQAPNVISGFMECRLSYGRISELLTADEIDFTAVDHLPYNRASPNTSNNDVLVKIENGSFKWLSESEPVLTAINMQCKRNELVAVVGKVGSGKSSLISVILGDMVKETGRVLVQGRIAYVPQVPWIINATLRDNILFGSEMDQELYDRVIDACALRADLKMLPAGDLTEIGEKGINLSGGQKARVSLARAVYSRADIYIMDDPLAAVDAHVGKHIFSHVLGPNGLLKSRARILATNAMQFLKYSDNILMIQDGQIIEQNTFALAMAQKTTIYEFIHKFIDHKDDLELSSIDDSSILTDDSSSIGSLYQTSERRPTLGIATGDMVTTALAQGQRCTYSNQQSVAEGAENGQTITAEVNARGKVSWNTYLTYLKSCGLQNSLLLLATIILSTISNVSANFWLKHWASANSRSEAVYSQETLFYYLAIYGLLGILGSATSAVRNLLLWARCSIDAATTIHQKMLYGVLRSPMVYFDTTPVGRILNRFSSDLAHCDVSLPYSVLQMVMTAIGIFSAVFVISMSTPLVMVFLLLLTAFYLNLQHRYMFTSRETKRLESSTRSPIIAHLQETIGGVSSIRAYGQQPRFIFKNEDKIEKYMRACYFNESLSQWLSIRLEAIGSIIMLGTTITSVASLHYFGTGDPGMVGLAVTYALSLTSYLNSSVKAYTEMENSMVQLERINEFANLPSEAPETIGDNRPAENWPDQGTIEFKSYSTRYREGLDLVLKGLSFKVKPMQKVGIVGRTGAGKSSLTLALFRLIEAATGQILIDGQDIAQYGLFDVRSKLSIIPQDPVLFAGTVRENLDPFGKYSDQEIWCALEHASLADFIRSKDERLEFPITAGGGNFSVGQRQLVCLARALLKKAKILVLDEATAAIDNQTDTIIQQSIRNEFKDCTVLTIAHRINTIIDSDMILVLDAGQLAEYDTPENLLQNKDSLFAKLVEESAK
ncbi:hypothetical protein IWW36_001741 [Coemansia brasiliensis]|uniref:Uncharacterized protein n=1 Tax=Coemansia brasiliensis TaxID=2650707 RepID=A0A9W8IH80_9FUNG|nr:hypothetical protein IWW36_001741 [Coemansia brasiliensis]